MTYQMTNYRMTYHLKKAEWRKIFCVLQTIPSIHLRGEKKLRRFIEAVWYVMRGGCQWRLLPWYYGRWRSVHARLKSWYQRGIWGKFFRALQKDPNR